MVKVVNTRLSKRYEALDIIKLFAAYMVVFIHISFQGKFGECVLCLARFAVPLFFIISGFFSYSSIKWNNRKEINRKIWSTGRMYVYSICGYLLMFICILRTPEKIIGWLSIGWKIDTVVNFILWNKFAMIEMEHLWFLGALFYCYLIIRLISRKIAVIQLLPALLIVNFVCGEFGFFFGFNALPNYIIRNAWFFALPCFGIGWLIRDKLEAESKLVSPKAEIFLVMALLSELLVLVEMALFGIAELYIGSILTAIFLFLFGIKANISSGYIFRILTSVDSSFIYIFHSVTAVVLRIILEKIGFIEVGNALPLITCFIVSIFSVIWSSVKKRMIVDSGGYNGK